MDIYQILEKLRKVDSEATSAAIEQLEKLNALEAVTESNDKEEKTTIAEGAVAEAASSYSAKMARAGKDIGKPGKQFAKIAADAAKRYGSKERGEKVAGAVLAKLRKEDVNEADMEEGNEFTKARTDAIRAGKPTFTVGGKTYKVTGDTSDEKKMMEKKEKMLWPGTAEYKAKFGDEMRPGEKRKSSTGGEIEKTATGVKHTAKAHDDEEETKADDGAPKRRGRPKGSKRALGAKGPTGKSKLLKKGSIKEATGNQDIIKHLADLRAVAKQVQTGQTQFPQGFASQLEAILYSAMQRLQDRQAVAEDYDKDEYDEEGEMAKSFLRTIKDAAEEMCDMVGDDENLPEWVQKKITLAYDYIDTARDYLKANRPEQDMGGEEVMAEKAVSKAQRAAAGIAYAAKKGDIPKSELRGASKEMAKMPSKELKKFAKTKEKGLPEKKKEESVEETTTAGSVATAPAGAPKGKKGMVFGKGVYEGKLEESYKSRLEQMLTEGMSINATQNEDGQKSLTVTATDEDAVKLAELLKLAGSQHDVCPHCDSDPCGCESIEEDYANTPEEQVKDTDFMVNKLAGGLNGPKLQVNPNNPGDNPLAMRRLGKKDNSGQIDLGPMSEEIVTNTKTRLWDLYKKYEG